MAKRIPRSPVRLCPKEPGANSRTSWTQGLWTCAVVGIPATPVCLAHKVATTVCPPPRLDTFYDEFVPITGIDLDSTVGCHSAGAQIDLAVVVPLYVRKCIGRVLRNH